MGGEKWIILISPLQAEKLSCTSGLVLWLPSANFFCHTGLAMHLSHICSLLWDPKLKGPVMWPVCHRGRGTSSPVLSTCMCRAQGKTGAESQGLKPRGGSEGSEGWSHPATGGPTVAPNPDTGLALARWAWTPASPQLLGALQSLSLMLG